MSSRRVTKLFPTVFSVVLTALPCVAAAGDAHDMRLQKVREGRFVYFADLDTVQRNGTTARIRSLQMTEEPMVIGEAAYMGGYSNWLFDCEGRTGLREDYASLRADGHVGPVTPTRNPIQELAPGGEAAALAEVACGETPLRVDARSLDEALALTRDF